MGLTTLSTSTVIGNLAADAEVKEVKLGDRTAKVAEATLYVRHQRDTENSFRVELSIWEGSPGWRVLDYLKKGSLIVAYGAMEPSPYITSSSNEARAGLQINPVDRLELISVKGDDDSNDGDSDGDN